MAGTFIGGKVIKGGGTWGGGGGGGCCCCCCCGSTTRAGKEADGECVGGGNWCGESRRVCPGCDGCSWRRLICAWRSRWDVYPRRQASWECGCEPWKQRIRFFASIFSTSVITSLHLLKIKNYFIIKNKD